MIERLSGVCVEKSLTGLVIDVGGVGYGVEMPSTSLAKVEDGQKVVIWVHTQMSQEALRLFGFLSLADRQMFTMLISASGLGPKIGMAIMSRFEPQQLIEVIEQDDAVTLEEVPGIGARQSKKFLLELKPKLTKLMAQSPAMRLPPSALPLNAVAAGAPGRVDPQVWLDLQSALENLGYRDREVLPVLKQLQKSPPAKGLSELMRYALSELNGARRLESGARETTSRSVEDIF